MSPRRATRLASEASDVEQWRDEGWVLVDGLVPADTVSAARAEIAGRPLDPPTHRGPLRRPELTIPDDEPAFREEQFAGTELFPVPGSPQLNRLFVHPAIVGFAESALGTTDLRIYQSRIWSKRGGAANYEQPLHRDGNHSLIPHRMEPGWWYLEAFLYLDDVDERNGAPRIVPRSAAAEAGDDATALAAAEVVASGRAGSLLAYRSDVWHRGTSIDPGAERKVLVVAFKPAGHEWIGFDAHPPLVINDDFKTFAASCTPRELELFGVPAPGHEIWSAAMVDRLAALYPGLDVGPWRARV